MTNKKITIELEYEQVDAILVDELKWAYDNFHPSKRPACGFRFNDEKEDLKEMKKMRKALKRVLEYYGATV